LLLGADNVVTTIFNLANNIIIREDSIPDELNLDLTLSPITKVKMIDYTVCGNYCGLKLLH